MTLTARPIEEPYDLEVPTAVCEVDMRTALARGFADYLRPLRLLADEGRRDVQLAQVVEARAEYETLANYPAAAVYVQGQLSMADGADSLTPSNAETYRVGEGTLQINGEATGTLVAEVWCGNPAERMLFAMAIENAAHPNDWRSGLLMELPYYFNQRASYLIQGIDYQDSDADVQRGYWKLVVTFQAALPYASYREFPNLDPRANIAGVT